MQESTLGQVLNSMARYIRLHNEALFIRVEIANGIVVIREELIVEQLGSIRQLIELAVGALFRMLRELMGNSWEPQRICFTHGPPASLVSHVRTFGRFVEFGCDFNGLVCSEQDLTSNVHLADPVMARYARQYIDQMFERPNMSTGDKLRQLVYTLLPLWR